MRTTVTYLTAMSAVAGFALTLTPIELTAQEQSQKDQRLSTATPLMTIAQRGEARESLSEGDRVARQKAAAETPVYVPPQRGAPSPSRRFGGGTRGGIGAPPAIFALAPPDHSAPLTLQEQPILYWFASSKITTPVELSLTDENGVAPEFEAILEPPIRAGIHAIRLTDYKIRLSVEKRYRWSVALVLDPERRSKDILTYGWIQRVEKTDQASWYDAMMTISKQIDATPANQDLHRRRAALLDQVELADAASYDKAFGKQERE